MKVLAALDIGTNAIRLEVIRVEPDLSMTTLSQQKETVRLGEGEFTTGRMTPAAIERGALVCARFADMARGYGADEIIAMATSAVREAENQDDFIDRVRDESDLEVRVISGPEEARLIHLGVASGANIGERRAMFIDIGGGSTELILGDAHSHFFLESLKLGSIRLSNKFLPDERGPISTDRFNKMKDYVRSLSSHITRRLTDYGFDAIYGSAGTISNLADITARRIGATPSTFLNYRVRASDLQATVGLLCRLSLEDRRKVPGLDLDRADIILGGAAVLMAILEDVGAEWLTISDRGLRDGILLDRMMQETEARAAYANISVRMRSIQQLARACNADEVHALHVSFLACSLFDELRRLGFHPYSQKERDLLQYAGRVHDIGTFLSHSNHHRHAWYLIRHSDLLGFTDTEISIIANLAYYHRKGTPRKRHENMEGLSRQYRQLIRVLSAMLRVAEGLDRSHLQLVKKLRLEPARNPDRLMLTLISDADCQLERWWVENNLDLFKDVFGHPLQITIRSLESDELSEEKSSADD